MRARFSSYAEPEKVSSLRLFAGDLDFGIGSEASLRITDVIVVVQFNLERDELLLLDRGTEQRIYGRCSHAMISPVTRSGTSRWGK